jgi:hypothetical protein
MTIKKRKTPKKFVISKRLLAQKENLKRKKDARKAANPTYYISNKYIKNLLESRKAKNKGRKNFTQYTKQKPILETSLKNSLKTNERNAAIRLNYPILEADLKANSFHKTKKICYDFIQKAFQNMLDELQIYQPNLATSDLVARFTHIEYNLNALGDMLLIAKSELSLLQFIKVNYRTFLGIAIKGETLAGLLEHYAWFFMDRKWDVQANKWTF